MKLYKNIRGTEPSRPSRSRNIGADTSAISVTQLNRQVKSLLENSFLSIRVQGELSNFAKPSSGHWYFTLKDSGAQIRCAMFKGSNRQLNFSPKEGDAVIVMAKVSLYEGRGDYQLICNSMEEAGSGRLQMAFEQLKSKLLKEGLFDASYKRPVPSLPNHLAVITSPTGAAIHDVLSVLKRRFPALPISIFPCQVQGAQASASIIKALQQVRQTDCDLILLTRGGGSLEDLWPFNEEPLARAMFACPIPIISAIGHEVDFSISDLVADYRAATPSAAAEFISPDQDSLKIHIDQLQQRLTTQVRHRISYLRNKLNATSAKLRSPAERLTVQKLRLENLQNRLNKPANDKLVYLQQKLNILKQQLNSKTPRPLIKSHRSTLNHLSTRYQQLAVQQVLQKRQHLQAVATLLHSISPLATLDRGYSITRSQNQQLIANTAEVSVGQSITTTLKSGELISTITQIK
ncbi:MAG: exodeoxyribonuclease VII large subunit [Oceanospirillaceae bacterium]|nr:exodeoxyribonuclease VII large subunit [Oceanospirillaceae bacterium]